MTITTEPAETALLPCPFCGATPTTIDALRSGDALVYSIECTNADCKAWPEVSTCNREEVIAVWNKREPASAPKREPGDALSVTRDPRDVEAMVRALSPFYSRAEADEWLRTPQRLLRGATPIAHITEGRGMEVWAVIEQLETGAFV